MATIKAHNGFILTRQTGNVLSTNCYICHDVNWPNEPYAGYGDQYHSVTYTFGPFQFDRHIVPCTSLVIDDYLVVNGDITSQFYSAGSPIRRPDDTIIVVPEGETVTLGVMSTIPPGLLGSGKISFRVFE